MLPGSRPTVVVTAKALKAIKKAAKKRAAAARAAKKRRAWGATPSGCVRRRASATPRAYISRTYGWGVRADVLPVGAVEP